MAVVGTPIYAQVLKKWHVRISSANTNRDGTGSPDTLLTAGANGSRVERFRVKAIGTTTAGMVRVFADRGASGTIYLVYEIAVDAVTPSGTVAAWEYTFDPADIRYLQAGDKVYVTTHNAESFDVTADGMDY